MSICLRGRNEAPELTVDDVVDLAEYAEKNKIDSSIVVPAEYGPINVVHEVGPTYFSQDLFAELASSGYLGAGHLQITPSNIFSDESIDFLRLMSFLHEKFPELKQYLEDTKEKEDEESTSS